MAHSKRALNRIGSSMSAAGVAVSLFLLASDDDAATVLTAGYLNDNRAELAVNDVIIIMAVAGGTGDMLIVKVTAVPATGNVTIAVNSEASGS